MINLVRMQLCICLMCCSPSAVICAQENHALTDLHRTALESLSKLDGLSHDERDRINFFVSLIFANARDSIAASKSIDLIGNPSLETAAVQGCATLYAIHNMPVAAVASLESHGLATPERIMLTFLAASNKISITSAKQFTTFPQVADVDRCRMLIIAAGNSSDIDGMRLIHDVSEDYPAEVTKCLNELTQSLCLLGKIEEAETMLAANTGNDDQLPIGLDATLSLVIPRALKNKEPSRSLQLAVAIKGPMARRAVTAELLRGLRHRDLSEKDLIELKQMADDAQLVDQYQLYICQRLIMFNQPNKVRILIISNSLEKATSLECWRQLVNYCLQSGDHCNPQSLLGDLMNADLTWDKLSECHLNVLKFKLHGTAQNSLEEILAAAVDYMTRSSMMSLIENRSQLKILLEDMRGLPFSRTQKENLVGAIRNVAAKMEMLDPNEDRFDLCEIGTLVLGELAAISDSAAAECYNELSEGSRRVLSDAFATSALNSENLDDVLGKCSKLSLSERADLVLRTVIQESVPQSIQGCVYLIE